MKNIFSLIIISILLFSCFDNDKKYKVHENLQSIRKPTSWGHDQKIYVVCDDEIWNIVNNSIRDNLSRKVMTTEEEPYFDIKRVDFEFFEDYYKFKNILFLGNISSSNPVSHYLKELLNENDIKQVKQKKGKLFVKTNLWANDQYLMFVMGDSNRIIKQIASSQKDKIFNLFANRLKKRLEFQAYRTQVHSMRLFQDMIYEIPIPENFRIYRNRPEERFFSFLSRLDGHADKYISIYYEQIPKENFTEKWVKDTRQKLSWKYYDEDYFEEESVTINKYKIGEHPEGYKLSGVWQNKKYTVGGAFQTFCFYDDENKAAVVIDNSVYFPAGYKLKALIELEEISKNIEIKSSKK